ncbi:MAG: aromatic ring-hydroxylating dioxygenase subunit alpha [Thermostichus sp. DG02_5_bins_236]
MLVTQQPVLKRFWYPVIPVNHLQEGQTEGQSSQPQPFELLGQRIVVWLDQTGSPAAVEDRCCHRTAQLSKGCVVKGTIQCPYHGWQFDGSGACVKVPQLQADERIPGSYRVKAFQAQIRYDYVWVCLHDQPLQPIPDFPEAEDPRFRVIHHFYQRFPCSGLRMMENLLDNAHFSIVHTKTFGDTSNPIPPQMELEELSWGLRARTAIPATNPPLQQKNLGIFEEKTVRYTDAIWFMPFVHRGRITYPNGLIAVLFMAATPINDRESQLVHFWIRSDREEDIPAAGIIEFNRMVVQEDEAILQTTDWDTPLSIDGEQHLAADKPGILMRRKLAALLKAYGETEQRRKA